VLFSNGKLIMLPIGFWDSLAKSSCSSASTKGETVKTRQVTIAKTLALIAFRSLIENPLFLEPMRLSV
jgi:hypothetical protein